MECCYCQGKIYDNFTYQEDGLSCHIECFIEFEEYWDNKYIEMEF